MSMSFDAVKDFWDYIECYPDEDEPGFDGEHYGGIKGLVPDAPKEAVEAYEKYLAEEEDNVIILD